MAFIDYTNKVEKDIVGLRKEKLLGKLLLLILDINKTPYDGIGHPEELKNNLQGWWSRKINKKHRLVYRIKEDGILEIASCYGHYDDK